MAQGSASMVENPEPKSEHNKESHWKKYDVFLSFRGADTRKGFVSHLYHELATVKRFRTFKDDRELEIGDPVGETLLKAIEDSHFAIVVLSENYAQSPWCLEELTKICQCMVDQRRILPLFYYVEPTHVRYQTCSFGKAFARHGISGRSSDKIQKWKEALKTVAGFSGCNANEHNTDREVVEAIVESVCMKVRTIESYHFISSTEFELFEATKEAMDKVMDALNDEEVIAVGVYGMGGSGKTTMVEHVAVEAHKHGLFHQVTMAEISQNLNFWKVQERLAFLLGVTLNYKDQHERAKQLMREIMRKERILIILDDIWAIDTIKLSNMGIPSLQELKSRSSKVLLTSRNQDSCFRMQCERKICLSNLDDSDSWRLFEKHTGMSFESTTEIHRVAREVASECAGLPVALKAVAKALGGKSLEEWKGAAMRLKASKTCHPEDNGDVFKSLKLSYDYLKSTDSKSCFLLCCLFPANYEIQIEDLLKYGIGKGLFLESNMQEARAAICSVVQSLKDSNLLLDGKMDRRCIRMHDVIRDAGLSISKFKDTYRQFFVQAGWKIEKWPTIDAHKFYTAISLMMNQMTELPRDLVFPKLQILLLQSSLRSKYVNEIPVSSSLFQHLEALRVLDISHNPPISLPPSSPRFPTSLHTLCLDHCLSTRGGNIAVLGQLKQLKILSMRGYPHKKLPEEIGWLTNLKLLDFTSESVEEVPHSVIGKLSNLEELYMQCCWGGIAEGSRARRAQEEARACFKKIIGLLDLYILKVFISDKCFMPSIVSRDPGWEKFDICILKDWSIRRRQLESSSSPVYSRALTLDISMDTLQKWFVDFVAKKTEKLKYIQCPKLCILTEYDSGRLHELKYLSVIGPDENMKELMSIPPRIRNEPVFQNLEELHLDQLHNMEKLCVGELPTGSLTNLRFLKMIDCHKLTNALESNLLQRLQKLENLHCEVMDRLKYVFSCEGSGLEQGTLPRLKEMRLDNLVNLIKIWNGPASCRIFDHVKVLVVHKCNKLRNIFTYNEADNLLNLEDLSVEACGDLERVIDASEEKVRSKIVLRKLKKLVLKNLSKLARFYGSKENATEVDDEENIEFPLLKHPDVQRCRIFKSPARKKLEMIYNSFHMRQTSDRDICNMKKRRCLEDRRHSHQ